MIVIIEHLGEAKVAAFGGFWQCLIVDMRHPRTRTGDIGFFWLDAPASSYFRVPL